MTHSPTCIAEMERYGSCDGKVCDCFCHDEAKP